MSDFKLPDLGEGLEDAEIVNWLVNVGDSVTVDQVVVEVETAKASVEVPIPFAGTVQTLHGDPGQRIRVGAPLISVAAGDSIAATQAEEATSSEYSGNVLIGYGTSAAPARRKRLRSHASPASSSARVEAGVKSEPSTTNAPAVISPVVRRLARDRGIDLTTVTASDPSGVIRRCDIEAFSTEPQTGPQAEPQTETGAATPVTATRIPLTGLRGVAAERLARSRREIPEATVWVDVDATELLEARRRLNAVDPEHPVSVLALVARFCVAGLTRFRELNSRITPDAVELLDEINLGIAAQTDRGLMVPVAHGAHAMSTRQLSKTLSGLTQAGRDGSLTPAQLTGGTFTVNNYGVYGVDGSAAIINHPEVAMLGIGRIIDKPWVVDGQLAIRKVGQLTLAFDHRACDGGAAGGFLRYVADCVEHPITALGDL